MIGLDRPAYVHWFPLNSAGTAKEIRSTPFPTFNDAVCFVMESVDLQHLYRVFIRCNGVTLPAEEILATYGAIEIPAHTLEKVRQNS